MFIHLYGNFGNYQFCILQRKVGIASIGLIQESRSHNQRANRCTKGLSLASVVTFIRLQGPAGWEHISVGTLLKLGREQHNVKRKYEDLRGMYLQGRS